MEVIREGDKFSILGMDLTEMLVLYTAFSDGLPIINQNARQTFQEPEKVLSAAQELGYKITQLMLRRTKAQAKIPFFKIGKG